MMKSLLTFFAFTITLVCFSQTDFQSVQDGPWDDPETWEVPSLLNGFNPTDIPEDGDNVEIGHNITFSNDDEELIIGTLTFGGNQAQSITVSSNFILTVQEDFEQTSSYTAIGGDRPLSIIVQDEAELIFEGAIDITLTGNTNRGNASFVVSDDGVLEAGEFSLTNSSGNAGNNFNIIFEDNADITLALIDFSATNLGGISLSYSSSNGFSPNSIALNASGTSTITFSKSGASALSCASGNLALSASVNGILNFTNAGSGLLTVAALFNLTNSSSNDITFTHSSSNTFNASSFSTFSNTGAGDLNFIHSGTGSFTVNQSLALSNTNTGAINYTHSGTGATTISTDLSATNSGAGNITCTLSNSGNFNINDDLALENQAGGDIDFLVTGSESVGVNGDDFLVDAAATTSSGDITISFSAASSLYIKDRFDFSLATGSSTTSSLTFSGNVDVDDDFYIENFGTGLVSFNTSGTFDIVDDFRFYNRGTGDLSAVLNNCSISCETFFIRETAGDAGTSFDVDVTGSSTINLSYFDIENISDGLLDISIEDNSILNFLNDGQSDDQSILIAGSSSNDLNLAFIDAVAFNNLSYIETDNSGTSNINITYSSSDELVVDSLINLTSDAAAEGDNAFTLLSDATIGNNNNQDNSINLISASTLGGVNRFTLGSDVVTTNVSLGQGIAMITAAGTSVLANQLAIYNTTASIGGSITLSSSTGSTDDANELFLSDDNTTKSITLIGDFLPTQGHTTYENASEGSTNFLLDFALNGTQVWGTNSSVSLEDVTISTNSITQFGGVLETIEGTATVNGRLEFNGFTPTVATVDAIHVNNDGILFNEGTTDHMVYTTDVVQFESGGLLIYETTAPDAVTMLSDDGVYQIPNVLLQGTGDKVIGGNIDADSKVGHIDLQGGTLSFSSATALDLTDGISSVENQTLSLQSNTILAFNQSVPSFSGTLFTDVDTEVIYSSSSDQSVFPATYFALTFSGNSEKNLTGTNLTARNKVSKSGSGNVNLLNTNFTLLSDASLDAYIAEITGGAFAYGGTGTFIIDKAVTINTTNSNFRTESSQFFRDVTIPIQEATLQNFKTAGAPMFGITGGTSYKDKDGNQLPLVYSYNESLTTNTPSAADFVDATNVTQLVSDALHGGWKMVMGLPGGNAAQYNFLDAGTINQGNQVYNLSFSSDASSDNAFRAANDGWHLIGNPYACAIDWAAIAASNSDILDADVTELGAGIFAKIWVQAPYDISNTVFGGNPNDYSEGTYLFYNPATGAGDPQAALIPQYQSFWVKTFAQQGVSNSETYSFTISESHKVDNQPEIRKSQKSGPEMFKVDLLSANNDKLDRIDFHEFTNATAGYDPVFDIENFGKLKSNAAIDFYANNEAMHLRVNAIGENLSSNSLSFGIEAEPGTYKIDLSDLKSYASKFDCATLVDIQMDSSISLNSDDDVYTFDVNSNQPYIFTFQATNNIDINTYSASCFGEKDGGITMDFTKLSDDVVFDIYKDFNLVYSFNNESKKFKQTFDPGDYTLVDKTGNLVCAENQTTLFTVPQPEQIKPAFTNTGVIKTFEPAQFSNLTENASSYEWYFADDLSYSQEKEPFHTFEQAGKHLVSLTAFGSTANCFEQLNKFVIVENATDIEALHSAEKPFVYSVSNKELSFSGKLNYEYFVTGTDGKTVAKGNFTIGNNKITLNLPAGMYYLNISSSNTTETIKFLLP